MAVVTMRPMYGEQHPARVALREARETVIGELSESFAHDELSLEEFEQRLDRAYAASPREEVQALVSDLSARQTAVVKSDEAARPEQALVQTTQGSALTRGTDQRAALAVFGNVERRGRFALALESRALAVFGNVEIDLRDAVIAEGVTELHVKAIFGNVEIIVPPTLSVECHGLGVFGNFEGLERVPFEPDGSPILRITGKAIFGNVEVSTLVRGPAGRAIAVRKSRFGVHSPARAHGSQGSDGPGGGPKNMRCA